MLAESDTISLTRYRLVGEAPPHVRFSGDTEGLGHASFRHARASGDAAWFWFFLFQNSLEDARVIHPASNTFGSRFHNVALVQEQEELARERRRSLLIHRRHRGGLTPDEARELERLQAESEAALAAELEGPLDKLRALADEQ